MTLSNQSFIYQLQTIENLEIQQEINFDKVLCEIKMSQRDSEDDETLEAQRKVKNDRIFHFIQSFFPQRLQTKRSSARLSIGMSASCRHLDVLDYDRIIVSNKPRELLVL